MNQSDQTLLHNYPWLNDNLFQEIIQKEYPQNPVTIKCWTGNAALVAGENYSSQMIRIRVTFYTEDEQDVEKEIRFIVKAELVQNEMAKLVKESNVFNREIAMYQNVLPEVQRVLSEIDDHTKLSARCYASCNITPYIIFEDLSIDGFRNTDRTRGMGMDHYQALFMKLAKFHAATTVLLDKFGKDHQMFDEIRDSIQLNEKSDVLLKFIRNSIGGTIDLLKLKYGQEERSKLIQQNIDLFIENATKCYAPNSSAFNAIIHSDLWSNNIMFKFDPATGVATEAMMVDYQICFYGPIALDLGYTLFTSSADELRDRDYDLLIQYYYDHFIMTLKKLNYSGPLPTLTDIHVQFLQRSLVNAFISIFATGIRNLEDVDDNTSAAFFNDTDEARKLRMEILSNPKCDRKLDFLLDHFLRKGYF